MNARFGMFGAMGSALALILVLGGSLSAAQIEGRYLEGRTSTVIIGPCFAAGEIEMAGKGAVMAWSVDRGTYQGVDLTGLNVVMVVHGSKMMGFGGLNDSTELRSLVIVDERADRAQREALLQFVKDRAGRAGQSIQRIEIRPIQLAVDLDSAEARLQAGKTVKVVTRRMERTDLICGSEKPYYPPLTRVGKLVGAFAVESQFSGVGIGGQWSLPDSRTAYLSSYSY